MHETSIQALLVEDNPGDIFLLQRMLADTPFWKAILDRLKKNSQKCWLGFLGIS